MSPVRRHLPTVRVRVSRSAYSREKLFERSHSQLQTQGSVAVVWIKPIVTSLQSHPSRYKHGLVPRAADLKEDFVLILQLNLFVINAPREIHSAVHLNHLLTIQTPVIVLRGLRK